MTLLRRLRALPRLSERLQAWLLLSLALPVLLLAGYGVFAVVRDGFVWQALAVSAAACVLAGLPLAWRRRKPAPGGATRASDTALLDAHEAPAWWTPVDHANYAQMLPELHAVLAHNPAWKTLPAHGLTLAQRVAGHYHQDKTGAHWAVTPVEMLAVTEALSRRYRQALQEYVPGAEHLHIAHWMWMDAQVERLQPISKLYGFYRKVRLISPEGWLAELRSRFLDQLFEGLSDDVQTRLKTVLLRDALMAAIDLYGGHYRHRDAPLPASASTADDAARAASPPEPVRVCLIGQTGAGKSSIVNALLDSPRAEVSMLPSTAGKHVYEATLAADVALRLVDLPGITLKTAPTLLHEMTQSDLVLWVVQANQPARALDVDLRGQLRHGFARTPQRQPPVLLGVFSQVDRLIHPGAGDDAQALIAEALAHVREQLDLDQLLALSLPVDGNTSALARAFPIDGVRASLEQTHTRALTVQLNRRRLQAHAFSARSELRRAVNTGKALLRPSS